MGLHVGGGAVNGRPAGDAVTALAVPAIEFFRERFGGDPGGVWHAPGRVNLIGEHTDYNDGFVLPFALGLGVRAAAALPAPGGGDVLELSSRQANAAAGATIEARVSSLAPGSVTGWAAYAAGVAWALREAGHQVGGARIAFDADLPQGAGLSSSAALECATALALTGLYGIEVPAPELARIARLAENEFVGVPSGIMDQSASLLCTKDHALLLDCRTLATTQVPFDPAAAGLELLVLDTRVRHVLADGEYADRRRACETAARLLGVRALRDITDPDAALGRISDPVLRRRARHVITDNHRVQAVTGLLRAGAMNEVGALLTASHLSLRDDFEISWPQADVATASAVAAGALGARMIGGGFGGSVIALVGADRSGDITDAVTTAFSRRGWESPRPIPASPEPGAHLLA